MQLIIFKHKYMVVIPTYAAPKDLYDAKKHGIISLVSGIVAMFQLSVSPLLAVLAVVAGILGIVFGVKQKRWGWLVMAVFGLFFGAIYLIMLASGEEF